MIRAIGDNENINSWGVSQNSSQQSSMNDATSTYVEKQHERKWDRDHAIDQIIGNCNDGVKTRRPQ